MEHQKLLDTSKYPGIAILLDNPCEDETVLSEQVLQKF